MTQHITPTAAQVLHLKSLVLADDELECLRTPPILELGPPLPEDTGSKSAVDDAALNPTVDDEAEDADEALVLRCLPPRLLLAVDEEDKGGRVELPPEDDAVEWTVAVAALLALCDVSRCPIVGRLEGIGTLVLLVLLPLQPLLVCTTTALKTATRTSAPYTAKRNRASLTCS